MNANSKAFVIIVMTNISWATSVRNKISLWPSPRIFRKRILKLPLCLSHLKPRHNPSLRPSEVEPIISLNALIGFSTPQTLKLISYIKHWKVIIWLIVEAPIILFITAFPKKLIATSMPSIISKS
jgi:hypothetical protein